LEKGSRVVNHPAELTHQKKYGNNLVVKCKLIVGRNKSSNKNEGVILEK
jgi:hypothetical protein